MKDWDIGSALGVAIAAAFLGLCVLAAYSVFHRDAEPPPSAIVFAKVYSPAHLVGKTVMPKAWKVYVGWADSVNNSANTSIIRVTEEKFNKVVVGSDYSTMESLQ